MLVDSHCHLDFNDFEEDFEDMLARARENGVTAMLNAGNNIDELDKQLEISEKYPFIYTAVGVHPHNAAEYPDIRAENFIAKAAHKKVVAIGECGLDYYYEEAPYDAQLERFARHIEAAKLANLPVIVHSRDAQEDTIRLLKEHDAGSTGFVLHCFTGDKKMAQDALDLGGYLSFSGIVTFKNATQIQEVASWVPSDRYLVETDCPYLAPIPFRGKRNEPSYVRYVARKVAFLRGETLEKVAEDSTKNFFRLFSKAELL